ncbi:MAG: hypothetical protein Q8O67_25455 [Deltaproteobacteria bacterium]|nr:hypothetical protein [Deltaproteobacteria bacterium]
MTSRTALAVVVAALAITASGCGKSIAIDHWVAPAADIGGAHRLVITDAYGRGESVAVITRFALEEGRSSAWFDDVVDVTSRDRLETDGVDAWMREGTLSADALYLRLDVLEDSAVVTANESVVDNGDGTGTLVVSESLFAHTLVSLTVADLDGVIITELEIEGIHEQAGPISDYDVEAAMEIAARAAVDAAFHEITPVQARTNVAFDDRDESINATLDVAIDGDTATRRAAIARLEDLDGAPALYNRAVLTESIGEIASAVTLYEEANDDVDAAGFYAETLAGARLRLQNARVLGLDR